MRRKLNQEYEVEGQTCWLWRFQLSFGIHIEHTESDILKISDGTYVEYGDFEGLIVRLPFLEVRFGTLWIPTQKEDQEGSPAP